MTGLTSSIQRRKAFLQLLMYFLVVDTLAGICGALLARGVGVIEAALAAAYINGRAGELAADRNGEGTVASDIFETIPAAITINN
ncbi:MAG: NAD(P)H-hydrate dehydratase [Candidatus Curtissbacteria bacterium]